LRAAGIEVVTGVLEGEARRDHAGFLSRVVAGRPVLSLKLAGDAGWADRHGHGRKPLDHRAARAAVGAWSARGT
jgi:hypothetical protein